MPFETVQLTDVGQARDHNEDAVYVSSMDGKYLLAVADGMGGHRAGDVASQEALDQFVEELSARQDADAVPALRDAVARANDHLLELAERNTEYEGMGTTLVAALISDETATIINIGDSRAYHLSEETIEQVTVDQSLVQELVEKGTVSEEEAESHPHSNVLSQALGTDESIDPDIYSVTVKETLLLCSDGLSDVMSKAEIHEIVRINATLRDVASELVNQALENGTQDNISVVLARKK